MSDAHALYTALHLANVTLTEHTRNILRNCDSLLSAARVILHKRFATAMRETERLQRQLNIGEIMTFADKDFPELLKSIDNAPFAFFLRGNRTLLRNKFISIVGTREPSPAGRQAAANLTALFSARKYTIVSGIARGIDSIAHHTALKNNGTTIAVLPNGFNHLYPLENRDLYTRDKSMQDLLLISEYHPDVKPQKHYFVRRNRLIAGLSALTLFVEGESKSGGMITVNHALKEGREVAALSHPSLLHNSGGDQLISDGAENFTDYIFSGQKAQVSA